MGCMRKQITAICLAAFAVSCADRPVSSTSAPPTAPSTTVGSNPVPGPTAGSYHVTGAVVERTPQGVRTIAGAGVNIWVDAGRVPAIRIGGRTDQFIATTPGIFNSRICPRPKVGCRRGKTATSSNARCRSSAWTRTQILKSRSWHARAFRPTSPQFLRQRLAKSWPGGFSKIRPQPRNLSRARSSTSNRSWTIRRQRPTATRTAVIFCVA